MRTVTDDIRNKYKSLFNKYVTEYGSLYDEKALEFIKAHFLDEDFEYELDVDILSQVYQSIGVYDEYPDNKYNVFYNYMSERYDLNQHLLEVASGMYPSFAKKVASMQKCGSVTAIDPWSILEDVNGIKVIKAEFTRDTDLSDYDFIYAIRPCEALEEIIRAANKNDLEFCALACRCTHIPNRMLYGRSEVYYYEYIEYIREIIESTIPSDLEYTLDYVNGYREPIISTKRLNLK